MSYLQNLKDANNYTLTENGAITHTSSGRALMDMFAMGGAYRSRSDADVILLFKNAFEENPTYALKCLFYLRDCRGLGQGERRFFRVCARWAADHMTDAMERNLKYVPYFGRWDDLYAFVDTKLENQAFQIMRDQLALDVTCKTPSLLAKWLKSENTSSAESRALGAKTRQNFGWTPRQYRKTLSVLRARINIVERLMSENRWSEIEFDRLPSKAGFIYRNAFARHDLIKEKYEKFAKDENTQVNAKTLYPYEVVAKAAELMGCNSWHHKNIALDDTERLMINKYWDNLNDYFQNSTLDALCVCDTSGSMYGRPLDVAISLSLYAAEKARGPFHGHFISFSRKPRLIETVGVDFADKVKRIYSYNLCENTNIEATFDMLLNVALQNHCAQEDLPKSIVIISDMEFDQARGYSSWSSTRAPATSTLMENIAQKWEICGYKMPNLVFWNVDARQNNIPMTMKDGVSFVSGFSPSIFQALMSGKTAESLMYEILDNERYSVIH